MKNYALFSANGRFIGFTNFKPTAGLYKEMPSSFDPIKNVYVGDYETGGLKNINELTLNDYQQANNDKKWKVYESDVKVKAGLAITRDHNLPIFKQLNAIMEVLFNNQDKIQLTEEFVTMYNKIQEVKANIDTNIDLHKADPNVDFIPKDQEQTFIDQYNQQHLTINEDK